MKNIRRIEVLRAIYVLCLLGATSTHVIAVINHGIFWDYGGVSRASAMFWTSLTVIDPLVVVLLLTRRNAGILATMILIVVDVLHNLWIVQQFSPPLLSGISHAPAVMAQIAFMIFVFATVVFAWERPTSSIS